MNERVVGELDRQKGSGEGTDIQYEFLAALEIAAPCIQNRTILALKYLGKELPF